MLKSGIFFNSNYRLSQKLEQLPYLMISIILLASFTGFLIMYAAAKGSFTPWASKQLIHFAMFFPIMIIVALIDLRFWFRMSYLGYFVVLLLLILVEITGHTAMGATRWINLGFIKLQPSELMKICLVFALARYFHNLSYAEVSRTRELIVPTIIILVPAALIIKQPDLGTGMILLMVAAVMFFLAGVQIYKFVILILIALSSLPFAWRLLHDYQKKRILTFLNPESDPLGAGYNIIQSKIAIGSGGFWGKGLVKGTQSQLSFLPEHQTDFVFTMLAEEQGFVGGVFILVLYTILIYHGLVISINSRNHFGKLLAAGITSIFFLHIFINMAMVMGLVPVVGVPLPFLSYGGTIMMTILIGFGLIINVHIHHSTSIGQNTGNWF